MSYVQRYLWPSSVRASIFGRDTLVDFISAHSSDAIQTNSNRNKSQFDSIFPSHFIHFMNLNLLFTYRTCVVNSSNVSLYTRLWLSFIVYSTFNCLDSKSLNLLEKTFLGSLKFWVFFARPKADQTNPHKLYSDVSMVTLLVYVLFRNNIISARCTGVCSPVTNHNFMKIQVHSYTRWFPF